MEIAAVTHEKELSAWQRWLHHPESWWLHRILFHIHVWVGIGAGFYILLMSLSGSAIVYRDALESSGDPNSNLVRVVEWLVDFHENLLSAWAGRFLNGIGATCLTLLCLTGAFIWWPGIAHWRRSLSVNFKSGVARLHLGPAQRARVLVFFVRSAVGNLRNLLLLSSAIQRDLRPLQSHRSVPLGRFWRAGSAVALQSAFRSIRLV